MLNANIPQTNSLHLVTLAVSQCKLAFELVNSAAHSSPDTVSCSKKGKERFKFNSAGLNADPNKLMVRNPSFGGQPYLAWHHTKCIFLTLSTTMNVLVYI